MTSFNLGFVIFGGSLLCLMFAVSLDALEGVLEDDRIRRELETARQQTAEEYDGDETVELYGPPTDQMTLEEFLDFWVLLSADAKDCYVKQSWSYTVI